MTIQRRYLLAVFVNLALPWLAYRLTFAHWGHPLALASSTLPLIAWMAWDLARLRHFEALSALVLTSTLLSLAATTIGDVPHARAREAPTVSGLVGVIIFLSLVLRRPLVFYLARSTLSREGNQAALDFDAHCRDRPELAWMLQLMTAVWGVGLVAENVLRVLIVWHWAGDHHALVASRVLQYGVYGALTVWTFRVRRRIRQQGLERDAALVASASDERVP